MPTAHELEQEDRREYLENEKRLREKAAEDRRASTYLAMAEAASLEIGGRYKQVSPMTVTGVAPIPQMPMQPENSPWNIPWPEGPDVTGYEINAMEPVGEIGEIERAAEILREREVSAAPSPAAEGAPNAPVVTSLATTVQPIGAPLLQSKSLAGSAGPTMGEPADLAREAGSPSSQSPPITGVLVVGDAEGSTANTALRTSSRPAPDSLARLSDHAARSPASGLTETNDAGGRTSMRRL